MPVLVAIHNEFQKWKTQMSLRRWFPQLLPAPLGAGKRRLCRHGASLPACEYRRLKPSQLFSQWMSALRRALRDSIFAYGDGLAQDLDLLPY
jgi:hypothetical protein